MTSDQYVIKQLDIAKGLRNSGKIDWIIVLMHKPWFTLKSSHSPYTEVREMYSLLFKDYGVDFILHGHNHNTQLWYPMIAKPSEPGNGLGEQLFSKTPDGGSFDFTKPHGQLFIVTGHGGHEHNEINDSGTGVSNTMIYNDKDYGYTVLEFEGKKAHVMAKNTQKEILYEYKVVR